MWRTTFKLSFTRTNFKENCTSLHVVSLRAYAISMTLYFMYMYRDRRAPASGFNSRSAQMHTHARLSHSENQTLWHLDDITGNSGVLAPSSCWHFSINDNACSAMAVRSLDHAGVQTDTNPGAQSCGELKRT